MTTWYVAPTGSPGAPGTIEQPLGTVQEGVDRLEPGDVLVLRGGSYAEDVSLAGVRGTSEAPVVIRAHEDETVSIDGAEPVDVTGAPAGFRTAAAGEWVPAEGPDAHPDEFVSVRTFPLDREQDLVDHGAFLDREPYTRLVTYSRRTSVRRTRPSAGSRWTTRYRATSPSTPTGCPCRYTARAARSCRSSGARGSTWDPGSTSTRAGGSASASRTPRTGWRR